MWEEKIFGSLTLVDWTEIHLMKGFLGKERIKVNHINGLGFINFPQTCLVRAMFKTAFNELTFLSCM